MITVNLYDRFGARAQQLRTESLVFVGDDDKMCEDFAYENEYDVLYVNMDHLMAVHVKEDKEDEPTSEEAGRVSGDAASSEGETESVSSLNLSAIARRFFGNAFSLQSRSLG